MRNNQATVIYNNIIDERSKIDASKSYSSRHDARFEGIYDHSTQKDFSTEWIDGF
jgi:hypothetical protein